MPLQPADQQRIDELLAATRENAGHMLGYPCNLDFDYQSLAPFLAHPLNNLGDPFAPCTYKIHTREFEREVLAWFAALTHIEEPNYWGYVTGGGTEGNIYGLYLARELHPAGLVYYSEATHYSVAKSLRVLNMRHIMIKAQPSGEIDYEDLRETVRIHRDVTPIVFATIGTTMTEAADDIARIRAIFRDFAIPASYIHADAAFAGMTRPYIPGAPAYDFRAGIDSLSISGHKFIGSPVPCGVVLAKRRNVDLIARSIEYVGTLDTTLSGSRSGLAPLILWYAIRSRGECFAGEVAECLEKAAWVEQRFQEAGIPAWRNPHALTVVFPRPSRAVTEKWQLASSGEHAHVIVLQSVRREQIESLIADIKADR